MQKANRCHSPGAYCRLPLQKNMDIVMKTIIVTTGFSPAAENALAYGRHLTFTAALKKEFPRH